MPVKQGVNRRAVILRAAGRLFLAKGYAGVSMDDVLNEVGCVGLLKPDPPCPGVDQRRVQRDEAAPRLRLVGPAQALQQADGGGGHD